MKEALIMISINLKFKLVSFSNSSKGYKLQGLVSYIIAINISNLINLITKLVTKIVIKIINLLAYLIIRIFYLLDYLIKILKVLLKIFLKYLSKLIVIKRLASSSLINRSFKYLK